MQFLWWQVSENIDFHNESLAILIVGTFVFKKQKANTVEILVSEGSSLRTGPRSFSTVSFQEFEEYEPDSDFDFIVEKFEDTEKLLRSPTP